MVGGGGGVSVGLAINGSRSESSSTDWAGVITYCVTHFTADLNVLFN